MFRKKEKMIQYNWPGLCCYFFIFAALFFSVLWRGSDIFWRIKVLQTLIFASFFFYGIGRLISGKMLIDRASVNKPIFILFFLIFFTSCSAWNKALSIEAVVQFLSCVAAFYVFIEMAKHRRDQVRLVAVVALITTGLCLFGFLIYFKIFLFPSWELIYSYKGKFLSSTFINHCHFAGWLEMGILFFLGLFFTRKRSIPRVVVMLFLLLLMVGALIFTLSRGGWISALSGAFFMAGVAFLNNSFALPKKYLIYPAGAALVILLIVLGSTTVTKRNMTMVAQESNYLSGREVGWAGTIDMIKANLLTGVGPGNYATAFTRFQPPGVLLRFYRAHNDYLQFIAEMGILFVPLMLWLVAVFFKAGFKKLKHPSRQTRWLTLGAMGGIVAILVHSMSDFNLQIPSNALLFTLLAAQVAAPAPLWGQA